MKKYFILLLILISFFSFIYAGKCCLPNGECCDASSCVIGGYKSPATNMYGCFPTTKWSSTGQYSHNFGSINAVNSLDLKLELIPFYDNDNEKWRYTNDFTIAKVMFPDGVWHNFCDLSGTNCIGDSIGTGINFNNKFISPNDPLNGIKAVASYANVNATNTSKTFSTTLPKGGNYKMRVYLVGTASGNRMSTKTYIGSSNHTATFFSRDAKTTDNAYYASINSNCSDFFKWNPTYCSHLTAIDQMDYIEYSWCSKSTEICDGLDNDCDGLVDEDFISTVTYDPKSWWTANPDFSVLESEKKCGVFSDNTNEGWNRPQNICYYDQDYATWNKLGVPLAYIIANPKITSTNFSQIYDVNVIFYFDPRKGSEETWLEFGVLRQGLDKITKKINVTGSGNSSTSLLNLTSGWTPNDLVGTKMFIKMISDRYFSDQGGANFINLKVRGNTCFPVAKTWYIDNDNDGFGNALNSVPAVIKPEGYVLDKTDCDDDDFLINPNGSEVCNGKDDDCDGLIDEDFFEIVDFNPKSWLIIPYGVPLNGPETEKSCDEAADNNFTGWNNPQNICSYDENLAVWVYQNTRTRLIVDPKITPFMLNNFSKIDAVNLEFYFNKMNSNRAVLVGLIKQGSSSVLNTSIVGLSGTESFVYTSPNVVGLGLSNLAGIRMYVFYPFTDGEADFIKLKVKGNTCFPGSLTSWYGDKDNDKFGDDSNIIQAIIKPDGYVLDHTDCNDNEYFINPNVIEVCNGIDDDCDGNIDNGFECVFGSDDCDSSCKFIRCIPYPEVCDDLDNDCDGVADENIDCSGDIACELIPPSDINEITKFEVSMINNEVVAEVSCSNNLMQIDFNLFDFDNNLLTNTKVFDMNNNSLSNLVDCNICPIKYILQNDDLVEENTYLITTTVNDGSCISNCDEFEYLYYDVTQDITIPDNNIILILLIVSLVGFICTKDSGT